MCIFPTSKFYFNPIKLLKMNSSNKTYPNIAQSWGIVGIAILAQILFSPVFLLLENVIGMQGATLIYYTLSVGGAFIFGHFIRKKETGLSSYNFELDSLKLVVLMAVFTIAMAVGITDPIASLIPMPDIFKQMFLEMASQNGVFGFITIVIVAPILEELIFRGLILDGMLKRYSPVKSVLYSSFLFAFIHLNPWQFIAAFLIGIFSGWIYYKTRKLSLTIIIHFVNNFVAFMSSQMVSPEDQLDQSLIDFYGGLVNAIIIISGCVLLCLISLWFIFQHINSKEEREVEAVNSFQ